MANLPNNPTWIEPPPQEPRGGCGGRGCLLLILAAIILFLALMVAGYVYFRHGIVSDRPRPIPVEPLPPEQLSALQERIHQFEATPASTPAPAPAETPAPGASPAPEASPAKQLVLTASEINGLIANNKRSRGHAFVSLAGNTAHVQVSIPSEKVPGFPRGYLNGSFVITTDGPTPISALPISRIEANGMPVPSSVLSMSYRGRSVLSYALGGAAPYNVSTAEIRNGEVILH